MSDDRERTYMVDDGPGPPDRVHPMPTVAVHRGTAHRHDYWLAVTDVPCPICSTGTVRWARGLGYRICDGCHRHYIAGGSAEAPTLIEEET